MTITTATHTTTRSLTALVTDLDRAVRGAAPGRATVDAVADALRPALGDPQLLRPDQRVGDPAAYRQHLLHVADDGAFSLVALVWLPGQATPIHDHLAWCVVGVHEGAEHETRYTARAGRPAGPHGSAVALAGDVDGLLPPGDIHRVTNAEHGPRDLAARVLSRPEPRRLEHPSALRRRSRQVARRLPSSDPKWLSELASDDHLGSLDELRRTAVGGRGRSSGGPPSARPGRRGRGPRR